MVRNYNKATPKFIRPFIRNDDLDRFHSMFLASGLGSYSEFITLLLDVFEEVGNDNANLQAVQLASLVSDFRIKLKKINPNLSVKFEEILKNGTGN